MDVFALRDALVDDYARYIDSFIRIRDERVRAKVKEELVAGRLWPEPLIQMNPSFAPGGTVDALVSEGLLHPMCGQVFRAKPNAYGDTSRVPLAPASITRYWRHWSHCVPSPTAHNRPARTFRWESVAISP